MSPLPFPAIDPVLFSIGPIAIRWYALAYIAGLVGGWLYGRTLLRAPLWKDKAPASVLQLDDLLLWVAAGVILGGRLGYVLFYAPASFAADPVGIIAFWRGGFAGLQGMSFHGGLIGVVTATLLYCRRHKLEFMRLIDVLAACTPIGLFFGRIANFINAELYGHPTDVPWAVIFPTDPLQQPRHPSQLYEAGLEGLVLFAVLVWLVWARQGMHRRGFVCGVFVAGYGLARMFVETFREPDAHIGYLFGPVTMGMLLSAPLVVLGGWLIWGSRNSATRNTSP